MCYSSVGLFIPSYLLLIRNKIFDKKYLFLFLIGVCAVLFSVYRTSIGTAWLVAVLPAVIWSLIDIKNNEKYSKKSLICFLLFYCICFLCSFWLELGRSSVMGPKQRPLLLIWRIGVVGVGLVYELRAPRARLRI